LTVVQVLLYITPPTANDLATAATATAAAAATTTSATVLSSSVHVHTYQNVSAFEEGYAIYTTYGTSSGAKQCGAQT